MAWALIFCVVAVVALLEGLLGLSIMAVVGALLVAGVASKAGGQSF